MRLTTARARESKVMNVRDAGAVGPARWAEDVVDAAARQVVRATTPLVRRVTFVIPSEARDLQCVTLLLPKPTNAAT
jgi:hypothetical protein